MDLIDTSEIIIDTIDGYQIVGTKRSNKQKCKGVIIINCGTGIPQLVYGNFAEFLTQNGYDTITYDYRGIGKSAPKSLRGFKATLEDWGRYDMTAVFDWVINSYPNDKKIVVGHSMGGQLIGLMQNNHQIDQIFLIASSTGYWLDMSFPYKLIWPPIWFIFIPYSIFLYGYVKAKSMNQGEDLPKGVALQWKKWCTNPNYFDLDLASSDSPLYFNQIKVPLNSIQISDDPIANNITASKILRYYKNAIKRIEVISPEDLGVSRIGHTGFFSRKVKNPLWQNLLSEII
ncbi:alpha/beta fold hydrolase [Roseivirga sp.]|uniref:alpha/beta hydrolase family protein n=1 Tax=Roseivirga sp. TaxID=1964215 RepID=UPI003B51CADD